ncbi:MAG: hypothetical protein U9R21_03560, partial [Candidatus Thermoplasmatota archaeon]|nr:hypothetical protein [Candidatus Thermoplasmatota archaeon]
MNYLGRRIPEKTFIFGIGLLFVLLSIQPIFGTNSSSMLKAEFSSKIKEDTGMPTEVTENSEDNCYGILVPLIHGENLPYTSIQQSISNLINDLLRMNISVYWASSNFTTLSIKTGESAPSDFYFERGTFIIPFTGNMTIDVLIASIAHDYESKSEIEEYYPVEMYYLMEPLTLDMHPLNYPKVAYHFGGAIGIMDLLWYLEDLQMGGFLDNYLLMDDEIADRLNNTDYNLFIWSGSNTGLGYKPLIETGLHIKANTAIRDFINNGGGYIGSCYGANAASSGIFIPFNMPQCYIKKIPTAFCLSLTSALSINTNFAGITTAKIVNRSHPVSFGLEKIQKSFYAYGPVFPWFSLDQNTQPLAILEDVRCLWSRQRFNFLPSDMVKKSIEHSLGKPIWVSSQFGKGKII